MLCINSRKTNTGTWKTPGLDQALRNMAGEKGGETAMRFYMKFPIYRPRGHGHPDVDDDIQKIWDDQLNEKEGHKFYSVSIKFKLLVIVVHAIVHSLLKDLMACLMRAYLKQCIKSQLLDSKSVLVRSDNGVVFRL